MSPASIPDPITVPLLQKLLRLPSDTGSAEPCGSAVLNPSYSHQV